MVLSFIGVRCFTQSDDQSFRDNEDREKKEKWRFCKYYLLLFSANRLRRFSRSCFFEKSRELQSVLTVMPLFSIVVGSLSCFGHYPWFFVSFHHRGCHLSILKYMTYIMVVLTKIFDTCMISELIALN